MRPIADESGFSLLEALLAMAIVGLASLALGQLVLQSSERAISAAFDTIEAALADARSRAIKDGRTILLDWIPAEHRLRSGTGRSFALPSSVVLKAQGALELSSAGLIGIAVFPDGTTSGATLSVGVDRTARNATVSWIDGGLRRE